MLFNWASFAVFFLATWGIMHFALASIAANDNKKFFMVFMAGIGGKLLITMMLVLICVEIYDPENTLVITPFLLMYFAFLVFETIYLVKASRKNS